MKFGFFSLAALTVGFSASAATLPNLFECKGRGLDVGYTTTSFAGRPTFSLKHGSEIVSRSGAEIRTAPTAVGTLVTVTVCSIPDHSTVLATLVVPQINLNRQREVTFDTALIRTTARTSIGGPALVSGVVNPSTYEPVTCTAQHVQF